jgi:hypothetical protein
MNNFTPRAQQVLALARKEADRLSHHYVGTEHVLLGLLKLGQGVAVNVLQKSGLDLEKVRKEVEKYVGPGPEQPHQGNIPYTPRVKQILALAGKEAKKLGHSYVGTEHILLGLLAEGDGVSARVLRSLNVDIERTRAEIIMELDPNLAGENRYPERQGLRQSSLTPDERAKVAEWLAKSHGPGDEPRPDLRESPMPAHPAIRPYLNHDEVLIWYGEPKKKFRFERKHLPLLLFMIPFCAFLFLPLVALIFPMPPTASAARSAQVQPASPAPVAPSSETTEQKPPPLAVRIAMALFAFCFIFGIMAWILYCGGFTLGGNAFLQGQTLYGVTNQRVIIVAGRKAKTVRSIHLGSVTDLRMKQWPDGLGSISAGAESPWPYPSPSRGTNTLLENIAEPGKVFKIMIDVRKLN